MYHTPPPTFTRTLVPESLNQYSLYSLAYDINRHIWEKAASYDSNWYHAAACTVLYTGGEKDCTSSYFTVLMGDGTRIRVTLTQEEDDE